MTTQTEALKLALKAMKSFQEGTGGLYEGEFDEEIKTCEEALAQPEQERNLKLLPREATPEMLEAMDECSMEGYDERLYAGHAGSVYMAAWDAFAHPPVPAAQPKEPEQEPVANGKLKVTLQDTPTEIELAQYKRMLQAACADLGAINEALGLDPNDGGAEPILLAIEELRGRSQEPMAWMVYTLDGTSVCVTDNPSSFTPEHRALPLYTIPPQRKPLTEEQIIEATEHIDTSRTGYFVHITRAIEAVHGIKE